jgi:hypothetical protein
VTSDQQEAAMVTKIAFAAVIAIAATLIAASQSATYLIAAAW